jgi:hypothetical protein
MFYCCEAHSLSAQVSSGDDHVSIKVELHANRMFATSSALYSRVRYHQSGMDLPGIHFNMSSERIIIEHNVFETVGS